MNAAPKIREGQGTQGSPLYPEILKFDAVAPSESVSARGNYRPEPRIVPFSVFSDLAYAKLEMEHVWKKVWQFACREEDVPNIGDRYIYDVGTLSFIIVRSRENKIQAFYNACLHRGTRLNHGHEKDCNISCPFHGWQWHLDGTVKHIPAAWDFPRVNESFRLPEVQVGVWGGCVFVNPGDQGETLDQALGVLKDHFRDFDLSSRFTVIHTQKKVHANWKAVLSAFLESYHIIDTHPQLADFIGDLNTQYDIFDDGHVKIGRLISPIAVQSPSLGDSLSPKEAAIAALRSFLSETGGSALEEFAELTSMHDFGRKNVADYRRKQFIKTLGVDYSALSDAEIIDGIQYCMLPNFCPWLGEGLPVMYQFLPYGKNPDESLFDVRLLLPLAKGAPRPPAPSVTKLDFDEPFSSIAAWGALALVFDQDMTNLPNVQRGMASAAPARAHANLGRYQEQRITLLHEYLDTHIAGGT